MIHICYIDSHKYYKLQVSTQWLQNLYFIFILILFTLFLKQKSISNNLLFCTRGVIWIGKK